MVAPSAALASGQWGDQPGMYTPCNQTWTGHWGSGVYWYGDGNGNSTVYWSWGTALDGTGDGPSGHADPGYPDLAGQFYNFVGVDYALKVNGNQKYGNGYGDQGDTQVGSGSYLNYPSGGDVYDMKATHAWAVAQSDRCRTYWLSETGGEADIGEADVHEPPEYGVVASRSPAAATKVNLLWTTAYRLTLPLIVKGDGVNVPVGGAGTLPVRVAIAASAAQNRPYTATPSVLGLIPGAAVQPPLSSPFWWLTQFNPSLH